MMKRRSNAASSIKPIVCLAATIAFVVSAGVIVLLVSVTTNARHTHGGRPFALRDPSLVAQQLGEHDPASHVTPVKPSGNLLQVNSGPDRVSEPAGRQGLIINDRTGGDRQLQSLSGSDPYGRRHPFLEPPDAPVPASPMPLCVTWGTWTEACYYENVCFDVKQRQLLMYDPGVASRPSASADPPRKRKRGPGIFDALLNSPRIGNVYESHNDLLTGQVLPLEIMPPDNFTKWLPMNSNMRSRYMTTDEAQLAWAATRRENARAVDEATLDDTAWITANKEHLSNIWYYSSRVTPWFELRQMNASRALPFTLPEPSTVYLQTSATLVSSDWHTNMLALTLQLPRLQLFPPVGDSDNGMRTWQGRRVPRVVYREHGTRGHEHGNATADVEPDFNERTRCFRRVVVSGASGFVFGSTVAASEFRAQALAHIGRDDQPKYVGPGVLSSLRKHNPPRRVLLIDRQRGKPRAITNIDAVKQLLDAYSVPYTHSVDFRGDFDEQVSLYNDHGVLLGVHGAGFINCMFMRQGSAVIEVFPYHLKHTLYMRQAYASGLTHFSVYAHDPAMIFKPGSWLREYMKSKCSPVTIPMRALEEQLVQALDMIGYRTDYKGLYNDDRAFTEADRAQYARLLRETDEENAAAAAAKASKATSKSGKKPVPAKEVPVALPAQDVKDSRGGDDPGQAAAAPGNAKPAVVADGAADAAGAGDEADAEPDAGPGEDA